MNMGFGIVRKVIVIVSVMRDLRGGCSGTYRACTECGGDGSSE